VWIARERVQGGGIHYWTEYATPTDDELRVPFEALALVHERRCCQALLSSSLALLSASRGSRSQLSEQLRDVQAAIETLCEPSPGEWGAFERWDRLADRSGVWNELVRGYDSDEVERVQRRLRVARNVAGHGADSVLLDLGYPENASRPVPRGTVSGEDLAFTALHADLSPLLFAVRFVLNHLWRTARASDWNDDVFEKMLT
jgi:hypothetical protein